VIRLESVSRQVSLGQTLDDYQVLKSLVLNEQSMFRLSVSNSLSGRDWELDEVSAVGNPTHIVQLGTGDHVSDGEG